MKLFLPQIICLFGVEKFTLFAIEAIKSDNMAIYSIH